MILFYSNQCKHCNILLEVIEKHDKNNIIKTISVETMVHNGYDINKIIHSVPALVIPKDNKINKDEILYGKQVFDYLLLPNRGLLFKNETNKNESNNESVSSANMDDPLAFSFSSSSTSEIFAFIEDNDNNKLDDHKAINWSSINENNTIVTPNEDKNSSNSSKKSQLPDISTLRQERELELQNHLNNTALPPVSNN